MSAIWLLATYFTGIVYRQVRGDNAVSLSDIDEGVKVVLMFRRSQRSRREEEAACVVDEFHLVTTFGDKPCTASVTFRWSERKAFWRVKRDKKTRLVSISKVTAQLLTGKNENCCLSVCFLL